MPISIKKMAANTSTATVVAGEDTAHIEYYPARINEEVFARMEDLASRGEGKTVREQFAEINEVIVELVKNWDIYMDEETGELFPIDAEALKEMPTVLRMAIIFAIMDDFRPEALMGQAQTQNSGSSAGTLQPVA